MIVACADAPAQSPLKLQATSEHIIRVEEQVCPPPSRAAFAWPLRERETEREREFAFFWLAHR